MSTVDAWSSISTLSVGFPAGAIVTAVSHDDGHIHLVAAGLDGGIWTTFYDDNRPGSAWTPWMRVGGPALVNVPQNLGPTAVARMSTRLELFTISSDQTLWTVTWDPQAGEAGDWHPIWTLPLFKPGTALSAVSPSRDRMHVLAIGMKGEIWSVTWDLAGTPTKWGPYLQISDHALVSPGPRQRVAVALRAPDRLDVFVVDRQGHVTTASSVDGASWTAWNIVHAEKKFSADALVTVVVRDADSLDLFVPGSDGGVWTSRLRAGAAWSPWARIGAAGLLAAPSHLAVTAIVTMPATKTVELFVTGKDGAVLGNATTESGDWGEWTATSAPSGPVPTQAILAAIACRPARLDLFTVGADGLVEGARRADHATIAAAPEASPESGRGTGLDRLNHVKAAVKAAGAIRKRHALLVGVDRYDNGDACPALKFCVADVLALREALRKLGYEEPIVLHDDALDERLQPTRANILRELSALTGSLDPADMLLVHFSCHGTRIGGDAYLLPRTAQLNDLRGTAVSVAEIRQIVEGGPALERVLFFDACHVGADVGRGVQGATLTPDFVRNVFEQAIGTRVLSGSTAQQIAHEQAEAQHGVFTGFVLSGLSGLADREAKGFVTFDDLRDYVVNGVIQWSLDHSFTLQQPVADGPSTGDMILTGAPRPA